MVFYLFIGDCLMTWLSKKQNSISLSTTKVENIVVRSYYMQLLWMKQMLEDYGIEQGTMNIHYDNSSAINILKNPLFFILVLNTLKSVLILLGILLKKKLSLLSLSPLKSIGRHSYQNPRFS